ncbi:MAG: hypothetical protein M3460_15730 [Actinomycetota bacterium]|nr:hypothetical protein [Actinomycetota bacterium]
MDGEPGLLMICDDDEPPDRYYLELRLDETARAIALAQVRCLSDRELIDEIFDDPELGNFLAIRALKERGSISQQNQAHLFVRLGEALTDDFRRQLSPAARQRSDRLLLHLGGLLGVEKARSLAVAQAEHRLVNRHRTALTLLRRLGVRHEDRNILRSLVENYGDDEAMLLLAKLPGGLAGYTCCDFVDNANPVKEWDGNYYQSVILERMARDGQLDYEHASEVHPGPFVRTIGRLGDNKLVPYLARMITIAPADLLPIAASVAGRLREREVVDIIQRRYNALRDALQSN